MTDRKSHQLSKRANKFNPKRLNRRRRRRKRFLRWSDSVDGREPNHRDSRKWNKCAKRNRKKRRNGRKTNWNRSGNRSVRCVVCWCRFCHTIWRCTIRTFSTTVIYAVIERPAERWSSTTLGTNISQNGSTDGQTLYPQNFKRIFSLNFCSEHTCPHCALTFTQALSLKRHLSVHTGEKNFKCECGKSYRQIDSLKAHRKRHLEPTIPCPYCTKHFYTKNELKSHVGIHTYVTNDPKVASNFE